MKKAFLFILALVLMTSKVVGYSKKKTVVNEIAFSDIISKLISIRGDSHALSEM